MTMEADTNAKDEDKDDDTRRRRVGVHAGNSVTAIRVRLAQNGHDTDQSHRRRLTNCTKDQERATAILFNHKDGDQCRHEVRQG